MKNNRALIALALTIGGGLAALAGNLFLNAGDSESLEQALAAEKERSPASTADPMPESTRHSASASAPAAPPPSPSAQPLSYAFNRIMNSHENPPPSSDTPLADPVATPTAVSGDQLSQKLMELEPQRAFEGVSTALTQIDPNDLHSRFVLLDYAINHEGPTQRMNDLIWGELSASLERGTGGNHSGEKPGENAALFKQYILGMQLIYYETSQNSPAALEASTRLLGQIQDPDTRTALSEQIEQLRSMGQMRRQELEPPTYDQNYQR